MKDRFSYLDGLRGIAALIVVIHHGFLFFDWGLYSGVPSEAKFQPWDLWLSGKPVLLLFFAGNFAVTIFFILSGFVLSHVFSRSDLSPAQLIVKRYVRLIVPVTAASIFALIVGLIAFASPAAQRYIPLNAGASSWVFSFKGMWESVSICIREALFTAPFTGVTLPTFNGVLWTMQVEFIGSVLLISTFWVAKRAMPRAPLSFAAGAAVLFLILEWQSRLSLFAAGLVLYWAFGARIQRVSKAREAAGIILISCGIFLGTMPESALRDSISNYLLNFSGYDPVVILSKSLVPWVPFAYLPVEMWHAAGAVLLLTGVLLSERARRFLSARIFLFLGYVSFSIYLVQANVRNFTAQPTFVFLQSIGMGHTEAMLCAVAVFAAATLLIGYVFANLVEGRSISWSGIAARRLMDLVPSRQEIPIESGGREGGH